MLCLEGRGLYVAPPWLRMRGHALLKKMWKAHVEIQVQSHIRKLPKNVETVSHTV
jgi:hypothetical protein